MASPTNPTSNLIVYSTPWCGYCRRLEGQLQRAGIAYDKVDIEQQPEAADIVERVNNGNQTVPTVVFPDGSALTNPSIAQIEAKQAKQAKLAKPSGPTRSGSRSDSARAR